MQVTPLKHRELRSTLYIVNEEKKLRSYWRYYANKGKDFHNRGLLKQAVTAFDECHLISKLLLKSLGSHSQNCARPQHCSGVELLFMSCHNLAACYNKLQLATNGENILRKFYSQIIDLCSNKSETRELRLEALSILDESLFSLASQLGYMGKTLEVRKLINQTCTFAQDFANDLNLEKL
jgi:hypothetical protein